MTNLGTSRKHLAVHRRRPPSATQVRAHDRKVHRDSNRGQQAQPPDDAGSPRPTLPKRHTLGTGRSAFPPESARFPVKIARQHTTPEWHNVFQQHSRQASLPTLSLPSQRRARAVPKQQGHMLVADTFPSPIYNPDAHLRGVASAGPTTMQIAKQNKIA